MGTYGREAEFYRMFAPKLEVAVPYAHFVDFVPGTADVVIVMEDLAPQAKEIKSEDALSMKRRLPFRKRRSFTVPFGAKEAFRTRVVK